MTYLGMTLDAASRAFGWVELSNWARHLPPNSAVMRWAAREARGDTPKSSRGTMRGVSSRNNIEHSSFGSDPIPVSDFEAWYYGE